jgi:formate hydrogenlyase subunit 3/multisubunit Na+/H+ antiporter MnhD subunit
LVALVVLAIAAVPATNRRWQAPVVAVAALILLIGSSTFGGAAVSYRLTHPIHTLGFVEDWLQILGEATAAVAGLAAIAQRTRTWLRRGEIRGW